jgi:hypothetical protein
MGKASHRKRRASRLRRLAHRDTPPELGTDALLRTLTSAWPPEYWAEATLSQFGGAPCELFLAERLVRWTSLSRVQELVAAVRAIDAGDLFALTFAAQVALLSDEQEEACSLLAQAEDRGPADQLRAIRALFLGALGRIADAIDEVDVLCASDPAASDPQLLRARILAEAERRQAGPASAACPCRSGEPYGECCAPREASALARFADDRPLLAVRQAVGEFARSLVNFAAAVCVIWTDGHREWFGEEEVFSGGQGTGLCLDWGLTNLGMAEGAEEPVLALDLFVRAPSHSDEHREIARQWLAEYRFGIWQAAPAQAGPGLLLTDLLTGLSVYAAMPASFPEHPPAWAVYLGMLAPQDGIWRPGAGLVRLSPAEAHAFFARLLKEAERRIAEDTPRGFRLPVDPAGISHPPSLLRAVAGPLDPEAGSILAGMLRELLPQAAAGVRLGLPPARNADDEPVEYIEARISVVDGAALRTSVELREDMRSAPGGVYWWQGRVVDQAEQRMRGASGMNQVRPTDGCPEWPGQRLVRAVFRVEKETIGVSTNSRTRYEGFLQVVRELDPSAQVISEAIEVPCGTQFPWAPPAAGTPHGPGAVAAWAKAWPDAPLPALGGISPRRAVTAMGRHLGVELMLRDLEFHADVARAEGLPAPDIAMLRLAVGLPDQTQWPPPFAQLPGRWTEGEVDPLAREA